MFLVSSIFFLLVIYSPCYSQNYLIGAGRKDMTGLLSEGIMVRRE